MAVVEKATRLLDLINAVDNVPHDFDFSSFYQLFLPHDSRAHGHLMPETVSKLPWTSDFTIDHRKRTIQVTDTSNGKDTSVAVNQAFQTLIDEIVKLSTPSSPATDASAASPSPPFPMVGGIHSEKFRIIGANYFACIERFPFPLFGTCSSGAHLTAYVRDKTTNKIKGIWIARRDANLRTYPGMLDTSVAGGVKAENTPLECIIAEADEEASLPAEYVQQNVVAAGAVTYVSKSKRTGVIAPTVLYVYDLALLEGEEWTPKPKDGEVEAFYLWDVDQVVKAMLNGEFKPNCNLVMIDFFIRHGITTQENEVDYLEVLSRLHRRLPVPTTPQRT